MRCLGLEGAERRTSTAPNYHSPGIHNPDEGGIVLVPEVARERMLRKRIPVEDPPATSVRRPLDD